MQETLEVRLKESTYQVVSDWPFALKMENICTENIESSDSYAGCKPMQANMKMQSQHPMYSTASQASRHFMYFKSILFELIDFPQLISTRQMSKIICFLFILSVWLKCVDSAKPIFN